MSYFNQITSRLIFRKASSDDVAAWKEFFIKNSLIHFLGLDLNKSPEELATNWISMQLKRYDDVGLGHLAVIEKDSGLLIGMAGIIPRNWADREDYEIAYSFIPRYFLTYDVSVHLVIFTNESLFVRVCHGGGSVVGNRISLLTKEDENQ